MSEDSELQAKIAQLAGRINRHKTGDDNNPLPTPSSARGNYYSSNRGQHQWTPHRGTPYGVPRSRASRARGGVHRNRTLVVNGSADAASTPGGTTAGTPPAGGWVSKRDRHMQLINNNVYEQKSQARAKAIEETNRQKLHQRNVREKMKLTNYLQHLSAAQPTIAGTSAAPPTHHVIVDGLKFVVTDGGSKLVRVKEEQDMHKATPKKTTIGGVMFLRSKHGNLYRSGLVKTKSRANAPQKSSELCTRFNTTGTCPKGPSCRYTHDPSKVAVCKDFLTTGKCKAGVDCDLSHDLTPERTPACLHFQRGNCTNATCRYTHVRTTPGANVCRPFATLGYCSQGSACPERHIHECPDYANKGFCRKKDCHLPHVDRAGQLRKAAVVPDASSTEAGDAASDVSSDEELEYDSADVDSDEVDEDILLPSADVDNHEISQQMDFVEF